MISFLVMSFFNECKLRSLQSAISYKLENFSISVGQQDHIQEVVLSDDRCRRKVSVGIPQTKYIATLSCEEGSIYIKSVAYGSGTHWNPRIEQIKCVEYGSGTHWNARIEQIRKTCNNQTQCKVAARDDMVDDPFRRVYKKLIIVYDNSIRMSEEFPIKKMI